MTQIAKFNPHEHLMQIKNKNGASDYLPVQWRLVWFRECCPDGTIETEIIHLDIEKEMEEEAFVWNQEKKRSEKVIKAGKGVAIVRAIVKDGKGGVATGTKMEKAVSFPDYLEKAETGAIGRALAGLGYGTQFAPELAEGDRIVDAPVEQQSIAPSEVAAVKMAWAKAYQIREEEIEARWPKYKVYVLSTNIPDPDLRPHHLSKMKTDIEAQKKKQAA